MSDGLCPRCGAPTIERVSRGGWTPGSKFTGCLDFPICRWSGPIASKWDIERNRQMSFLRSLFPPKVRIIYLMRREVTS